MVPKVTDFSQSEDNLVDKFLKPKTGALPWCAPEVLNGNTCSFQSDIYSYGVVLWELWTEMNPSHFGNMTPLELAHQVVENEFRFPIPENSVPPVISQLIRHCWAPNGSRPPFKSIIRTLKLEDNEILGI